MSLAVTLMIEGQEDLTWKRWQRLAEAAESGGFAGLFRSDHLTGLFGDPKRASLEPWASLTWLATATRTIRFGPLVSPLTFHHPALVAKRAAAIDVLSGGRLDLGIGAGWHEGEHRMFGIPFPPVKERLDRLDCGARAIRALWRGQPVTLDQPYYPLVAAESYPRPTRGFVPLIIGGRGELPLRQPRGGPRGPRTMARARHHARHAPDVRSRRRGCHRADRARDRPGDAVVRAERRGRAGPRQSRGEGTSSRSVRAERRERAGPRQSRGEGTSSRSV